MNKNLDNALLKAFNVKKNNLDIKALNDFDIFSDKQLLEKIRNEIISSIASDDSSSEMSVNDYINQKVDQAVAEYNLTSLERNYVFNLIDNEVNGVGPITELMEDDNITEILITGPKSVFITTEGNTIRDKSISFINDDHIIKTVKKLIVSTSKTIDSQNPSIDVKLNGGERLTAMISPLVVGSPIVSIKKSKSVSKTLDDLVGNGMLTPYMARFLSSAVRAKMNILISGSASSGKTTVLNALVNTIKEDRIALIEEVNEIKTSNEQALMFETTESNMSTSDLLKKILILNPERIILGELSGVETFDYLQLISSGYEGSITTIASNNIPNAMKKLEFLMSLHQGEFNNKMSLDFIASSINLVVQVDRLADNRRKITKISEISRVAEDKIMTSDIFSFKTLNKSINGKVEGEFILHERLPLIYPLLMARGQTDLKDMFTFEIK